MARKEKKAAAVAQLAHLKKGRARFIEALADTANVSAACQASKLSRRTVYNWRDADEKFKAAWAEAVELGTEALEDEAVRRAHAGIDKPVYQGGEKVGTVREYSDTLLIFLLKARRPEKYKDRGEVDHKSAELTAFLQMISGHSRGLPGKERR